MSYGPFAAMASNQSYDKHNDIIIRKSNAELVLQLE